MNEIDISSAEDDKTNDLVKQFIPSPDKIFQETMMPVIKPLGEEGNQIIETLDQFQTTASRGIHQFAELVGLHSSQSQTTREKTGGRVLVREDGVVVNIIPIESAQIWVDIAKGLRNPASFFNDQIKDTLTIPCAPILSGDSGRVKVYKSGQNTRVFSRYCGFNLYTINDILLSSRKNVMDSNIESETKVAFSKQIDHLNEDLHNQAHNILELLDSYHIVHGHPHFGNFTVEFWPRSAYHEALRTRTLNTETSEGITFDLRDYFLHLENYQPVVRLIDFDRIQISSELIELKLPEELDLSKIIRLVGSGLPYEQIVGLAALRKVTDSDLSLTNGILTVIRLNKTPEERKKSLQMLDGFYKLSDNPGQYSKRHKVIDKFLILGFF